MKTVDRQVALTFGSVAGGVLLVGLAALVTAAAQVYFDPLNDARYVMNLPQG